MKVRFWGVRGSLPVPGPRTERYGGNTSCVEVQTAAGTRIIIDAGTGLRRLGKEMMRSGVSSGQDAAHILISHTHWDHIQGLPFFTPLYQEGNRLHVYARKRDDGHLRSVLASQAGPPYFPVTLDDTRAEILFHNLPEEAAFQIDEVRVTTARLNHPYTATAYALQADNAKVAYVADTAPFANILFGEEFIATAPPAGFVMPAEDQRILQAMREAVVRLCEGADLVIYDTMYTAHDYEHLPHFGHSRPSDAIAICRQAGAHTLALFHHAPERSDSEVDQMVVEAQGQVAALGATLNVVAAFEGLDMQLGSP